MENDTKIKNDFKINVYFSQDGEEIEELLASYLSKLLNKKVAYV